MVKILHVIDRLAPGGPTRSMIAGGKYADRLGLSQEHRVIALQSGAHPMIRILAKQAGMTLLLEADSDTCRTELEQADVVQVHFWNNPSFYEWLRTELPPCRLLLWFKIVGNQPPQIITPQLLDHAAFALATSPYSLELPVFQNLPEAVRAEKTGVVYGIADFDRLKDYQPQAHDTFNVGYIGTVNFAKMHPQYVPMSSQVDIPGVQFIVCGGGIEQELQTQATELGAADRFQFRGYVENIRAVLETLDVFGYPLCADTYATSEKSLQEAMYAGVPPVVFPHGGVKCLVEHDQTGLVVHSEAEYGEAIEYLYHHPEERKRLGRNAKAYAEEMFSGEKAAQQLHRIYEQMMVQPKRERRWPTEPQSGTMKFLESLGDAAPQFATSADSDADLAAVLTAEQTIAKASQLLSGGEGGIFQYRNAYPEDAQLRLWSGLILQKQGQQEPAKLETAISEFNAAIDLGFDHWRVHWYLAQAAITAKQPDIAMPALSTVIQSVPGFMGAQLLLQTLENEDRHV